MATNEDMGVKQEDLSPGNQGVPPKAPEPEPNTPPVTTTEEPPKEEVVPEKQDETTEEVKPEEDWLRTGDEVADTAIDLMKDAGVSVQDAEGIFGAAMQSGKVEDIDIAALEAKVGKAKANLVMAGIRDWHTRVGAKNMQTVQEVHAAVGGEDAWGTLRTWAQAREGTDSAFAADLAEYRAMIEQGGKAAKFAAAELVALYNADPKTKGLVNSLTKGDGKAAPVGGPLGRAEYYQLIAEAEAKGDRAAVAYLNARRQAGMKAGI